MELLDALLFTYNYIAINRKMYYGENDPPAVQAMKEFAKSHNHVPVPIEDYEYMRDQVAEYEMLKQDSKNAEAVNGCTEFPSGDGCGNS